MLNSVYLIRRRLRGALAVVAMAGLLAACGSDNKTEEADASKLLDEGLAAQTAGDVDKANGKFTQVIEKDPKNKFAYYNLGLNQQNKGEVDEAENNYRSAIRIDPKYAPALYNLGIIRADAGSKDEAVDLYTRATVADPQSANAFLNLGLLLDSLGKREQGKAALQQAVKLDASLLNRIPAAERP